jgi:excisionase family DNA binding protein
MRNVFAREEELERLSAAAKLLKVTTGTLRDWCKSGRVKYHRLGPKLIFVSRSEVSRIIRESQIVG